MRTGRGLCLDPEVGCQQRDLHVRAQHPGRVRGSGASRIDRWPPATGLQPLRNCRRHVPSLARAPASPQSGPHPQRVHPPGGERPAQNRLGRLRRRAERGAPRRAGPCVAVARYVRQALKADGRARSQSASVQPQAGCFARLHRDEEAHVALTAGANTSLGNRHPRSACDSPSGCPDRSLGSGLPRHALMRRDVAANGLAA